MIDDGEKEKEEEREKERSKSKKEKISRRNFIKFFIGCGCCGLLSWDVWSPAFNYKVYTKKLLRSLIIYHSKQSVKRGKGLLAMAYGCIIIIVK